MTLSEAETFMQHTLELGRIAADNGADPFGALLVYENQIVAESYNKNIHFCDPTAHAELNVIRTFCREHQIINLEDYVLFSSTEPCLMCCGAIHWARISTIYFSTSQATLKRFSGGKPKFSAEQLLNFDRKRVEIIGPILENAGIQLLEAHPIIPVKKRIALKKKGLSPK